MSTDFKRMIEIVLQEKPEINAEIVKDMIEEKKRTIGAGYLTDQGASFSCSGRSRGVVRKCSKDRFWNQGFIHRC